MWCLRIGVDNFLFLLLSFACLFNRYFFLFIDQQLKLFECIVIHPQNTHVHTLFFRWIFLSLGLYIHFKPFCHKCYVNFSRFTEYYAHSIDLKVPWITSAHHLLHYTRIGKKFQVKSSHGKWVWCSAFKQKC